MYGVLAQMFHRSLKGKPCEVDVPDSALPAVPRKIAYKTYHRAPRIELPEPLPQTEELGVLLAKRRSRRVFGKVSPSRTEIATIFSYAASLQRESAGRAEYRTYPSGGSRYPLELYLAVLETDAFEKGIYHFNVRENVLEHIGLAKHAGAVRAALHGWEKKAPMLIITTAVWDRTFQKYGNYGYKIVLVEAGHLAHNVQLVAESVGLAYCSLLGFDEAAINDTLDIGETRGEHALYITALGTRALATNEAERSHSLMDRTRDCGSRNAGPTPAGNTKQGGRKNGIITL